ncbi:ATP-dependent helicase [Micromonospora profundi]|uniref:DNA 3'-5' helicase n=1 Tax=Micromonospora profundi TaxID=1420889 RepID=A0AAJ6HRD9_9ACTN|nr:ATP-dependent helicase [Micromonospora profundi]WLS43210.1 ATP-dependent helicase [Micromonospora profundi]
MELDETRRQILTAPGHLLILGGPGCGKTTIALLKAATLLDNLESEQRVLFLSFSRAAVRQISDRMRGTLTKSTRDRLEVRTFHSFFLELVRAHGPLRTGKPSAFIPPDRERQLRADFTGDWNEETHRLIREEGRYVFDRLAETAATLLTTIAPVRALYSDTYPLIIVDEFQDTSDDQWQAVKALSSTSTIACLADPDQRIYEGFVAGVDEKRIEYAIAHLHPETFDLSADNHRSPGSGLLDYANAVLRNDATQPVPQNVATWTYQWAGDCEARVHGAIVRLREVMEGHLGRTPTIAVLASTNALVARISEQISADREHPTNTTMILPAIDHELNWDPALSAAAGYVVASIMEWPGLARDEALTGTLRAIADYYRIKLDGGVQGARAKISTIDRAITALQTNTALRSNAAKIIATAFDAALQFVGQPVSDWQLARGRLRGAAELEEIFNKARLLRLFKATDALAWELIDAWNGTNAYTDAALAVRRVLANETLEAAQAEPVPVSLMNMHKSKGKEFDTVIIAEGQYNAPLLKPDWSLSQTQAARRLLRVAITRARHVVIFVRPIGAEALTTPEPMIVAGSAAVPPITRASGENEVESLAHQ